MLVMLRALHSYTPLEQQQLSVVTVTNSRSRTVGKTLQQCNWTKHTALIRLPVCYKMLPLWSWNDLVHTVICITPSKCVLSCEAPCYCVFFLLSPEGKVSQSGTRCCRATFLRLPTITPGDTQTVTACLFSDERMGRGEREEEWTCFHSVFYDLSLTAPIVAGQGEKEKGPQLRRAAFQTDQSPRQQPPTLPAHW